jgi:hypothetical protein
MRLRIAVCTLRIAVYQNRGTFCVTPLKMPFPRAPIDLARRGAWSAETTHAPRVPDVAVAAHRRAQPIRKAFSRGGDLGSSHFQEPKAGRGGGNSVALTWPSVFGGRPDRPSRGRRRIVPDVCKECSSKSTHCSKVHGSYHPPRTIAPSARAALLGGPFGRVEQAIRRHQDDLLRAVQRWRGLGIPLNT